MEDLFDKGSTVSKPADLFKLTKDFYSVVLELYFGS